MEILRLVLLFVHLVGFASLFGGLFVQFASPPRAVTNAVLHGSLTMLVSGLLLVGVLEGMDAGVDNAKIGAKLVVTAVIVVVAVASGGGQPSRTGCTGGCSG